MNRKSKFRDWELGLKQRRYWMALIKQEGKVVGIQIALWRIYWYTYNRWGNIHRSRPYLA
jgi:hypothetical protein